MILVTVGTQLPFDRLIRMADEVAGAVPEPFVAQIGKGGYRPSRMRWYEGIEPTEFDTMLAEARLIISHAGIGSLLMAQKYCKPIILVARRASLKEHRNDHQLMTASALRGRHGVQIADTAEEIARLLGEPFEAPSAQVEHPARDRLRRSVADFIRAGHA